MSAGIPENMVSVNPDSFWSAATLSGIKWAGKRAFINYAHTTAIHHIHKWPPCNLFLGYVFKEFSVLKLPSTTKYVILRSFRVFG